MNITSISFFLIILFGMILYYSVFNRFQWVELLVLSVVIYYCMGTPYTIVYVLLTTFITWLIALKLQTAVNPKILVVIGVASNFLLLGFMKYMEFAFGWMSFLKISLPAVNIVSALGVSYYTLQMAGYLLDVSWKIAVPQKNYFKLLLFCCYFPQMISGPISKYGELDTQLYNTHRFDLVEFSYAAQNILWGLFLKLVIAERASLAVNALHENYETIHTVSIFFMIILFTIQLYCDFSGCMYIVGGVSKCFGIKLPENFKHPYFSTSVQNWWQRWHITLGRWARDYIMYPLLKSSFMDNIRGVIKSKYGKKAAKRVCTYFAMFTVWLYIGIWHGGAWKYILGLGMWSYIIIIAENEAVNKMKISKYILIPATIALVSIGNVFFLASSIGEGVLILKSMVMNWGMPNMFTNLNMIRADVIIMGAGIFILFLVDFLEERYNTNICQIIAGKPFVIRWIIWYVLMFSIIIFGLYGEEYEASKFIYQLF